MRGSVALFKKILTADYIRTSSEQNTTMRLYICGLLS